MEKLEINDRVFCHVYGMGVVKDVTKHTDLYYFVKFDNNKAGFYTISGRLNGTAGQSLFSLETKPTKQ
jgi:hypothetical protein